MIPAAQITSSAIIKEIESKNSQIFSLIKKPIRDNMELQPTMRGIENTQNIPSSADHHNDPPPALDVTRQTGYSLDTFRPRSVMSGIGGAVRSSDKMQNRFHIENLSSWESVDPAPSQDGTASGDPNDPVTNLVAAYRSPSQRMDESRRKLPATRMQRGRLSDEEQKKVLLQRGRRLGYTGRNLSWRKDNVSVLRSDVKPKKPNTNNWFRPRNSTEAVRPSFLDMQSDNSGAWNQSESIPSNAMNMVVYGRTH